MTEIRVAASAVMPAAPAVVYGILADYRAEHPGILPPEYFHDLTVEQGGVGAGTVIRLRMGGFGGRGTLRGRVEEPEPGRILRLLAPPFLRRVYARELDNLARAAAEG